MRPHSVYLDRIKNENVKGALNLAGSTPPLPPALAGKKVAVRLAPEAHAANVLKLKKWITRQARVSVDEVVLIPGSTQAAFQVLAATTDPGDTIVLERPVYEPYVAAAEFLGLKVRRFQRTRDFDRDLHELRAVARGARVLLISNPHCPSGWCYPADCVDRLAELGLTVVIDEVFLPLFERRFSHGLGGCDNVITLSGLSKSTGLGQGRIGWAIARPKVAQSIQRMGWLLHVEFPQPVAAVTQFAFKNWRTIQSQLLAMAEKNRDAVAEFAKTHPQLLTNECRTEFFTMLKCPAGYPSGEKFVKELLRAKIFVRDGGDFEMPEHVRFHIMVPPKQFAKFLKKVESYY